MGLTISDVEPGAEVLVLRTLGLVGDVAAPRPYRTAVAPVDRYANRMKPAIVRVGRREPEKVLKPKFFADAVCGPEDSRIGIDDTRRSASGVSEAPERLGVQWLRKRRIHANRVHHDFTALHKIDRRAEALT